MRKEEEEKEIQRKVMMQEANIYERNQINCMSSIVSEVLSDETQVKMGYHRTANHR